MVLVAPVQPRWAGGCHNCCLPGVLSVHLLVPAWEALVALLKYQFLQPWGDAELSPQNRSRQQEKWQHDQAVAEGPPNTFFVYIAVSRSPAHELQRVKVNHAHSKHVVPCYEKADERERGLEIKSSLNRNSTGTMQEK